MSIGFISLQKSSPGTLPSQWKLNFFPLVAHVYFLLPLYINQSLTKKFPIETLLKIMDSSVKSLGEVEYDKQNRLKLQKIQVWPKNLKRGLAPIILLSPNINRYTKKKFPIETLLEMMDSSFKKLGKVEYDKQNWLQHHKTQAWPKNLKWGYLHCQWT